MRPLLLFLMGLLMLCLSLLGCDTSSPTLDDGDSVAPDTATWRALGLDDVRVTRLRLFNQNLYAVAPEHGLYRLDVSDRDAAWEFLTLDTTRFIAGIGIRDVVEDAANPDRLLASYQIPATAGHRIYRSLDGGASWSPADMGLERESNGIVRYGGFNHLTVFPDRIVGDVFWTTFNFGDSWELLAEQPIISGYTSDVVERHPTNHNVIWAGGVGSGFNPLLGIVLDRRTWTVVHPPRESDQQAVLSIGLTSNDQGAYVGLAGLLIKTTDRGTTWEVLDTMRPSEAPSFPSVLVDPREDDHVWAIAVSFIDGRKYELLETRDAGSTWSRIETLFPDNVEMTDLVWDMEWMVLYIATEDGVYQYRPC